MTVRMEKVESSSVEAVGYDRTAMELHVKFRRPDYVYVYQQVPPFVYYRLTTADSVGQYINDSVVPVFEHRTR